MQKTQGRQAAESVRLLAVEIGARQAARKLGLKEKTVLTWARRYDWKLPRRKGGRPGLCAPVRNQDEGSLHKVCNAFSDVRISATQESS
jgi:transposase